MVICSLRDLGATRTQYLVDIVSCKRAKVYRNNKRRPSLPGDIGRCEIHSYGAICSKHTEQTIYIEKDTLSPTLNVASDRWKRSPVSAYSRRWYHAMLGDLHGTVSSMFSFQARLFGSRFFLSDDPAIKCTRNTAGLFDHDDLELAITLLLIDVSDVRLDSQWDRLTCPSRFHLE